MPTISVIIPVYNVQEFISDTIQSVLTQSFTNFELIVVDDGSTDNSPELIHKAIDGDERAYVITQSNQGQAVARNTGIEHAKGEFLTFLDGDDLLRVDYLRILYAIMKNNSNLDVVALPHLSVLIAEKPTKDFFLERAQAPKHYLELSGSEYAVKALSQNGEKFNTSFVSKLFRKSLFDEYRIPVGHFYEDLIGVPLLMIQAKKVAWINEVQYVYLCNRPGSTVNERSLKKSKDVLWALDGLLKAFGSQPDFNNPLQITIVNNIDIAFPYLRLSSNLTTNHVQLVRFVHLRNIVKQARKLRISKRGVLDVIILRIMHSRI